MGLNDTPTAERIHIGFFGLRNAGKSSLVNRVTNQEMSVVSDVRGTTTDPVRKSMELLPLGPVSIIDTPGFDDEGELGMLRVARTRESLAVCDIAVLVTENDTLSESEKELLGIIQSRDIPYVLVRNKSDLAETKEDNGVIYVSAKDNTGIEELKEKLASLAPKAKKIKLIGDLIQKGDRVVLVIPIDKSAPKGRLILPQQEAIRDILDAGGVSIVSGVETLADTLAALPEAPALVVTDSQVFSAVSEIVPEDIALTSFSILMARYKGFLESAVRGARKIDTLTDSSHVLISEGCTHHRQCEDIGTVKIPAFIKKHTGASPNFEFSSGHSFPENLSEYDLVIHCGGCMLNDNEMRNRMQSAASQNTAFTNYGTAIAYMNGILERSIKPVIGK